ncbi:MAG: hypothetical protein AAFX09_10720 [Pseudomonadota bacterium]
MRFTAPALLAAASLTLAGCQTVQDNLGTPEPNPGPCPNALSLYDAHRLVEFPGSDELLYENIGFTGEILNVASLCRYSGERAGPIDNEMAIRFAFGRGPAAVGDSRVYRYFITVTRRDMAVIDRFEYEIPVTFEPGQDRVVVIEEIDRLSIPRLDETTSGANFEILVGFVLTDEQIEFNRQGLRFRIDAGQD